MEVVGVVAATLQLGTTVRDVCKVYSQIRGIDEFLHDLDNQLDATRMILAVLEKGTEKSEFDASTEGWWRQSEVERLLRSCNHHYQRMKDIFNKISRQRSSASALRAWIRTKQYDSDINHLRLCINTCTDALQLPVIMYQIHTSMQVNPESSTPGVGSLALEKIASRLARLETSVEDTRNDLKKRNIEQSSKNLTSVAQSTTIEKLIESLELDLSKLASLQRHEASSSEKQEMKARLSQMQDTISQIRIELRREGECPDTSLSLQEIREKADLEEDSRSTLELVDEIVGGTKDYASTIGCLSTVSEATSQPCAAPDVGAWASMLPHGAGLSPFPQSLSLEHLKDDLGNVIEWVSHTNDDNGDSVVSRLLRFHSSSLETSPISDTPSTATMENQGSFRKEWNRRLVEKVREKIQTNAYVEAIVCLKVLFLDNNRLFNTKEPDRLPQLIVGAIELKRDISWAASKCEAMGMGDSRMHNLANRSINVLLPEGLQCFGRSVTVTPVWAAALRGKLETVAFLLSLQGTDAVTGSLSVLLLGSPDKGPTKVQAKSSKSTERPRGRNSVEFKDVLDGVFKVFNSLPMKTAKQLISCLAQHDRHWCFVGSSFLHGVLNKCGKESADLPVRLPRAYYPNVITGSLLDFFFFLVTLGDRGGLCWAGVPELTSMLQILLAHSRDARQSSDSKTQGITILIDHVDDVIHELRFPDCLKSYQTSMVIKKLNVCIEIFAVYTRNNCAVSRANILKLQECIVLLALNTEGAITVHGELDQFSARHSERILYTTGPELDRLLQTQADLIRKKDNLVGLVRTGKRLGEILGGLPFESRE